MRERRLRALDDTARDRATQPANRASPSARGANGWTGGQYSAVRFAIGACLLAQLLLIISGGDPWGEGGSAGASVAPVLAVHEGAPAAARAPAAPEGALAATQEDAPSATRDSSLLALLSLSGAALSALLALGVRDRVAALLLSCVVCGLVALAAPAIGAGAVAIAVLLLLQAWLPRAPYGSWDARGRVDPGGDWRMPASVHAACWCALAIGYALSGAATFAGAAWGADGSLASLLARAPAHDSPLRGLGVAHPQHAFSVTAWGVAALQIGFAPLALFPRVRPWLWLAFFGAQIARLVLADGAPFDSGIALLHLLAFDPAWLRARSEPTATIFYDGGCGLCHRTVRFVLAEDRDGVRFRFAPLEGRAFAAYREAAAHAQQLEGIDSIVLALPDGRALVRAAAILEIGSRLGGIWRAIAIAARALPRRALDAGYDAVARVRRRIFASPPGACPTLPPELRERFDHP